MKIRCSDCLLTAKDYSPRMAAASLALMLGGCASFAPEPVVPAIVSAVPTEFDAPGVQGEYRPERWWEQFEDPVLNALVDRALTSNLDIAASAGRLERARAQARIARAALFPSIQGGNSASYSDSPLAGSGFGGFGGAPGAPPEQGVEGSADESSDRLVIETYSPSLAASYELDLFGRVRGETAAARNDAAAALADLRSVQLSAAAETISTYLDIVDTRRQIEVSLATIDVLGERVERTENRFQSGLAESFEIYQVRQEFRNAQAQLPIRESQLFTLNGALALLVGEYTLAIDSVLEPSLQPRLTFAPVQPGLPIDLLYQRPDVAAAWQRLEAARQRVGARRAERFPRLSFTASVGSQSDSPVDALNIFDNWFVQLGANLTAPIFQGGRVRANIDAAEATYEEAAAIYARAVLNGYRETVAALQRYEENRQRYRLIWSQYEEAQASHRLQSERFRAGVGNYITYLDALRAIHQVEASLSSAARDVAIARLDIHRALGGDWFAGNVPAPDPIEMVEPASRVAEREQDQ